MNALFEAPAPYQGATLALVSYFVTALWMGIAITALAALVVRVWKPLDAAARYAVWYVALVAVVLGPLATSVATERARPPSPAQLATLLHAIGDVNGPVRVEIGQPRRVIALAPYAAYGAAAIWLLVVLGGSARFVAGVVVLARLKRDALPLSPERRADLPLWRAHAGAAHRRRARLCVSDRVEVPVAVGLFDGMVVVPQQVMDEFEPGDVDRFVLHELAHLERRDDWTTVVQRLVQIVLFFNPAVHVIARQLDLEREIACDDRVIAATSDVRSYAVGLTRMAESTAWPHSGIAAPAIFITRRQLSLRVEQLLSGRRLTARRLAFAPAVLALVASLGVVAAATPIAPVVGFTPATGGVPGLGRVHFTRVILTDKNGNRTTLDSDQARIMVYRADATAKDARSLRRIDPKELDELLKRLGARAVSPHDLDVVVQETIKLQQPHQQNR